MNRSALRHNYNFLDKLFKDRGIEWGVVTKVLCGNELFIHEVMALGVKEVHDSRISNLEIIKKLYPDVTTAYIKPPPKRSIKRIVRFADVSFNTEFATIKMLSEEAKRQGKVHRIIIMIEMGDLREGVLGEELLDFYKSIFRLPNIDVIGIGTNLNCLYGVMPTQDKLIQLSLYKQLIEAEFGRKIPWVSGGTSVVVPLLLKRMRPMAVNHFRVGEALFFGNDLFTNRPIKGMRTDVFRLHVEIIELTRKPTVPIGYMGQNVDGRTFDLEGQDYGAMADRAIGDIGLLDINPDNLVPEDKEVRVIEASSDMLILDPGGRKQQYQVGDTLPFRMTYMGALRLLSSSYIGKEVVD